MPPNQSLYDWLAHPLLLFILGALITNYLIPRLTRRWQDHQRELDIKIGLVERISESVTAMVMAVQFAMVGAKSQTQEEFDQAFLDWEIKRATIGSNLRAYFPKTNIGPDWDNYSELVTDFYTLTGIFNEPDRKHFLRKMQNYTFLSTQSIDWDALSKREDPKFAESWDTLKQQILGRKDELVQRILNSDKPVFSSEYRLR